MNYTLKLTSLCIFLLYACGEKELPTEKCQRSIIVSSRGFEKAKDDAEPRIRDVSIIGDCMNIEYSHGGGCKDLKTKLLASENTTQNTLEMSRRDLKLCLDGKDNCKALVSGKEEFDITVLRGDGNSTLLRLHGWNSDILYTH